jgi:hypothetical protein
MKVRFTVALVEGLSASTGATRQSRGGGQTRLEEQTTAYGGAT